MAEKTGQRIARPIPFRKVRNSNVGAFSKPKNEDTQSMAALIANQICVAIK